MSSNDRRARAIPIPTPYRNVRALEVESWLAPTEPFTPPFWVLPQPWHEGQWIPDPDVTLDESGEEA
jgi:hypothetical protein